MPELSIFVLISTMAASAPSTESKNGALTISLRNPGLISIPLGFLAVIFGSLLYRDPRAESLWDELYVRQHTGIMVSRGPGH